MKTFLAVLFLFAFTSAMYPQIYKKGVNNLNIGIGPGLAGIYGSSSVPSISAGLQLGIHEKISVGGIVGYSASTYGLRNFEWTYSYIVIGARGDYHFVDLDTEDFDVYGGLTLAYTIVSVSEPSNFSGFGYSAQGSYLLYGFHVGGRYFFSDNIGVFLELGYGVGYIVAGVTFRI